jgi:hypothetical protein
MVFDDGIDGGGHASYRASPSVDGTRRKHARRNIMGVGGDPSLIIDNYRKTVAANVARLSSAGGLPRALSGVRSDVQIKQAVIRMQN